MQDAVREGKLHLEGSGTPIEREYRIVCDAMARCGVSGATFDGGAYDRAAVEKVRDTWRARMAIEHRSTTVFSQLAAQLMEANASLDAKVVMLRMAQDELRHTETCGDAVRAMGGEAVVTIPLDVAPLAVHRGCSAEERALRNVIYTTSMSEMIAVARFVDTIDTMSDPYLRDRNRLLLSDEVLHGQFGFHYLAAWQPWLDAHPDVRVSIGRYLRHAFVIFERELATPPPMSLPPLTDDEIALGLTEPKRAIDVFYTTLEQAVLPGLDQLGIEASRAWRTRSLES